MTPTNDSIERMVEKGADLEHDRWARWQKYFFSKCKIKSLHEVGGNDDRYVYFALPKDLYERWTRQIETPYADLSEEEKESDRKEARTYLPLLNQEITTALAKEREEVDENTSDGHHTFKELYEFRLLYNAALFNEWAESGKYNVHKSWKHNDGEKCFGGGWFIVMADLPTGHISNHYEEKDWDLFHCETRELADKWDGHTAQDVADRLQKLTTIKNKIEEN